MLRHSLRSYGVVRICTIYQSWYIEGSKKRTAAWVRSVLQRNVFSFIQRRCWWESYHKLHDRERQFFQYHDLFPLFHQYLFAEWGAIGNFSMNFPCTYTSNSNNEHVTAVSTNQKYFQQLPNSISSSFCYYMYFFFHDKNQMLFHDVKSTISPYFTYGANTFTAKHTIP